MSTTMSIKNKRPSCKIVARRLNTRRIGDYVLYENGELWTTGKQGYLCGHISEPGEGSIDSGIDAHEEEMRVLIGAWRGNEDI